MAANVASVGARNFRRDELLALLRHFSIKGHSRDRKQEMFAALVGGGRDPATFAGIVKAKTVAQPNEDDGAGENRAARPASGPGPEVGERELLAPAAQPRAARSVARALRVFVGGKEISEGEAVPVPQKREIQLTWGAVEHSLDAVIIYCEGDIAFFVVNIRGGALNTGRTIVRRPSAVAEGNYTIVTHDQSRIGEFPLGMAPDAILGGCVDLCPSLRFSFSFGRPKEEQAKNAEAEAARSSEESAGSAEEDQQGEQATLAPEPSQKSSASRAERRKHKREARRQKQKADRERAAAVAAAAAPQAAAAAPQAAAAVAAAAPQAAAAVAAAAPQAAAAPRAAAAPQAAAAPRAAAAPQAAAAPRAAAAPQAAAAVAAAAPQAAAAAPQAAAAAPRIDAVWHAAMKAHVKATRAESAPAKQRPKQEQPKQTQKTADSPRAKATRTPGNDEEDCSVCLETKRTHAFLPCGHMTCCGGCAAKLKGKACPICRKPVLDAARIYR
jgi:histone H1/5